MRAAWATAFLWVCALALAAQAPPAPTLLPGEGLAMAAPDGRVFPYGDAARETPLGGLGVLPWLRLEGDEWVVLGVEHKCKGEASGRPCGPVKGHGRVDLAKALRLNCDQAILAWTRLSAERWQRHLGEGVARLQLMEVFAPFLGRRAPAGDTLPELGPEWSVEGELLRGSPAALAAWMADPHQEEAMGRFRRLIQGFTGGLIRGTSWWAKTAQAKEGKDAFAWVVGGNGEIVIVLRLPAGSTPEDALKRFRAVLQLPPK